MKYKVIMIYDYGEFTYGTYDDRDKANEVGHQVSSERECDIRIEEVQ